MISLSSTLTLRQFHVGFRLFETRRVRVRVRARFRGRFRQFHVGFRLFETRRVRLGLELGLGVGLGASKLLIADFRYATHGNRVPVAGTGYTT